MTECKFKITKELTSFIKRNKKDIREMYINYNAINFRMNGYGENEQIMTFRIDNTELYLDDYNIRIIRMILCGVIKENDEIRLFVEKDRNDYMKNLDENAKINRMVMQVFRKNQFIFDVILYSNVYDRNVYSLSR